MDAAVLHDDEDDRNCAKPFHPHVVWQLQSSRDLMHLASKITGCDLTSIFDIEVSRIRRKGLKILRDS